MSDDGKSSNATIKIVIAVVLFGIAGYFVYANFLAGPKSSPKSAAESLPEDVIQQNEQIQKEMEALPPEQIGGA